MPAVWTSTTTDPGRACGAGMSETVRTSGAPCSVRVIARMAPLYDPVTTASGGVGARGVATASGTSPGLGSGRSDEHAKERGVLADPLDLQRRLVHALEQAAQVGRLAQGDADERGAGFAIGALDVLEHRDVVVRTQHVVEEAAQRTGLLREVDDEVVLDALVDERALEDLRVAADVVVAAAHQADRGGARRQRDGSVGPGGAHGGRGQRAGGLREDALDLVELQPLCRRAPIRHR